MQKHLMMIVTTSGPIIDHQVTQSEGRTETNLMVGFQ